MISLYDIKNTDIVQLTGDELKAVYATGYVDGNSDGGGLPVYIKCRIINENGEMLNKSLSQKQLKILEYLIQYHKKSHEWPSNQEIANYFSLSRERVRQHMNKLIAKGYVVKVPYSRKDLYVTCDGRKALEEIERGRTA